MHHRILKAESKVIYLLFTCLIKSTNYIVSGGATPAVQKSIYKTENGPLEVYYEFYLKKTLNILQQVETTVTAVVL